MSLWEYEGSCWARGHTLVCGCDEAGAGPLAGPVYAAAVILPRYIDIPGLNDSKQLTEKRREALYPVIQEKAENWAIACLDAAALDATDILSARMKAIQKAMDCLSPLPHFALIDGNRDKGKTSAITISHCCIVKGDSLSASVAAASVLAKVSRDHFMLEMARLYPEYCFEKHKGYGTKLHYELLDKYGPSPIHRKTFLKTWASGR